MSNTARVLFRNAENGMFTTRAFASSPVDFRFSRTALMETAALSIKYASFAPRLSASIPSCPLPANRSSTVLPSISN